MLIRWLRNRRRRALLKQPFPPAWLEVFQNNVLFYGSFRTDEQAKIRDYVLIFVAEKHWEGCGGLEMTDGVRVTIAAQVAILVYGFGHCWPRSAQAAEVRKGQRVEKMQRKSSANAQEC